MKSNARTILTTVTVALLVWGLMPPLTAEAGPLVRLAAQFRRFDGTLDITTAAPLAGGTGGLEVYTRAFGVPKPPSGQQAVVFITVSATAEEATTGSPNLFLACLIDSIPCNPGGLFVPGWVAIQNTPNELDSNGIYYTWCAKVSRGPHTASIRIASSDGINPVGMQEAHFYIDRTTLPRSATGDCEVGLP